LDTGHLPKFPRFAIADTVIRPSVRAYVWGITALLTVAGCHRKAVDPDESFKKLELSIVTADAGAFYDLLDKGTQKSIEGTWRDQQLQRTIISAKFPESEAGPALARLAAAAANDPRSYFVALNKERKLVEAYRKRLGSVSGPIMHKPDGDDKLWIARQDGMPFHWVKSGGEWRFGELAVDWALEKDRASHAVATVRENAKLYQKAAE
jgi:hypothetical protein